MMEKVSKGNIRETATTEEVKMAEENVLLLTAAQDIKPTSAPSTLVSGIVEERQTNLAQYGSVQSWGWLIVLASFLMQSIGGY